MIEEMKLTKNEKIFMLVWSAVILSACWGFVVIAARSFAQEEAEITTCKQAVRLCQDSDGERCARVEDLCVEFDSLCGACVIGPEGRRR